MTTWNQAWHRALITGSAASVLSAVMLAICGKFERGAAAAPLNGPSQWVWDKQASYRSRPTWRHTAVGYFIHHLASLGWATLHEKHLASLAAGQPASTRLLAAVATAAFACSVDCGVARGRWQPGFEKRLSPTSLAVVYAAFAVGLVSKRRD
jgi:hypothetical protein